MNALPRATPCRRCGTVLDAATDIRRGSAPQPGCVSICFYCAELSVFDDALLLVEPDAATLAELLADPEITRIRAEVIGAPR